MKNTNEEMINNIEEMFEEDAELFEDDVYEEESDVVSKAKAIGEKVGYKVQSIMESKPYKIGSKILKAGLVVAGGVLIYKRGFADGIESVVLDTDEWTENDQAELDELTKMEDEEDSEESSEEVPFEEK